jgi:hypothetical protein
MYLSHWQGQTTKTRQGGENRSIAKEPGVG